MGLVLNSLILDLRGFSWFPQAFLIPYVKAIRCYHALHPQDKARVSRSEQCTLFCFHCSVAQMLFEASLPWTSIPTQSPTLQPLSTHMGVLKMHAGSPVASHGQRHQATVVFRWLAPLSTLTKEHAIWDTSTLHILQSSVSWWTQKRVPQVSKPNTQFTSYLVMVYYKTAHCFPIGWSDADGTPEVRMESEWFLSMTVCLYCPVPVSQGST